MQEFEVYKNKIDLEVSSFKKASQKIKDSDNPKYAAKDVQDYEIELLKTELDEKVAEIKKTHDADAQQRLAQAKEDASKTFLQCAGYDKDLVNHHIETLQSDIAFAYNEDDREKALEKFERQLEYMAAPALDFTRKQLAKSAGQFTDKAVVSKLRELNRILSGVGTPEQMYADDLAAHVDNNTVDYSYRIMELVKSRKPMAPVAPIGQR